MTVTDEGVTLSFAVPTGFDLSKFKTGDKVLAFFTRNADGTLALKVLAGDANAREADDEDEDTGDDDGDHHDGDHGGGGHDGGGDDD